MLHDFVLMRYITVILANLFQISGHAVGNVMIVPDMHQRKAEMARQADAFIALPGVCHIAFCSFCLMLYFLSSSSPPPPLRRRRDMIISQLIRVEDTDPISPSNYIGSIQICFNLHCTL